MERQIMTRAALLALAERVERGDATNEEIASALGWRESNLVSSGWWYAPDGIAQLGVPAWLTSLDAAVTLVPEWWVVSHVNSGGTHFMAMRTPAPPFRSVTGKADTEPQARTAAALRARAAMMGDGDNG